MNPPQGAAPGDGLSAAGRWGARLGAALLGCFWLLAGCSDGLIEEKKPVALILWHVYGAQTDSPMNRLVARFNETVGREKGIVVNVGSLSNSADIHFALVAAARRYPGAGELPDLFVAYPKTALAIGAERLADWKAHFSADALREFVPSFVEEGYVAGRLVLLPIAKSSSALFINAMIFERFSKETGIGYEDLDTWEGVFRAARRYRQWSGGKAFFKHDDWLHYSMLNTAALGGVFFRDGQIDFDDTAFRAVWGRLAASALAGDVSLLGGYSTTAMMTGEAVCGVGSTASVLYFKDHVTFPDNTTSPLRLKILPVPHFREGARLAIQRGGGLALAKSTPEKERAAAAFAEWLTAVENNVSFVAETGYFPVRTAAYRDFLEKGDALFPAGGKYRELFEAIRKIHADDTFFIPPFFEGYGELEKKFSDAQTELFKKYRGRADAPGVDALLSELEAAVRR
ncbi:MAG: extracellular solute-binding protein [Candidatus Accumulibacter sp.]|jgi:multiple sugar transport system substrate-binding protein|nr:extracellular solute-binding protein [Accumulibacter sp.]